MRARDDFGPTVLEHSRHPRYRGTLPAPDVAHERAQLACPDRVRFELNVVGGIVSAVRFRADACAICTAAASRLSERVLGEPLEFVEWLEPGDVIALLDETLPETDRGCALLALEVLQGAVQAFRGRWDEEG